jgi:hypothetical protein
MFKRLLLIGFLCIGLIALTSIESTARCRLVNGKMVCSDVCADTFLQGVGNPDVKPVYVCAVLYIDEVLGQCWNKPYNATKAKGTSFFPHLALPAGTFVKLVDVDDKGWAEVKVCWTNICEGVQEPCSGWPEILDKVQEEIDKITGCSSNEEPYICDGEYQYCPGAGICVNPNWWFDQCKWTIEVVYVYYVAYQYDENMNLQNVSPLCSRCERDPQGEECGFSCSNVNVSACEGRGLDVQCNPFLP